MTDRFLRTVFQIIQGGHCSARITVLGAQNAFTGVSAGGEAPHMRISQSGRLFKVM
ncbi:MAG: hypothetical protein AAF720_08445 [Pseudomonadota bacterium]